jgi:hypothetical protein
MNELLERYSRFRHAAKDHETERLIEAVQMNINTALIQCERIAQGQHLIRSLPRADRVAFLTLFADIHFFVIVADDIGKCVDKLQLRLNSGELKQIMKKYRYFFDAVKEMRNHHEHLHERIHDENLYYGKGLEDDWTFEMCGSCLKVGPAAEPRLLGLYEAIYEALGSTLSNCDMPERAIIEARPASREPMSSHAEVIGKVRASSVIVIGGRSPFVMVALTFY